MTRFISCRPRSSASPAILISKKLNTPADVATLKAKKYQPITFRGQPAWELFVDHPYTHEHTRSVIFNDAGNWYELMLKRPELESLTGDPWQAYFESAHTRHRPRRSRV